MCQLSLEQNYAHPQGFSVLYVHPAWDFTWGDIQGWTRKCKKLPRDQGEGCPPGHNSVHYCFGFLNFPRQSSQLHRPVRSSRCRRPCWASCWDTSPPWRRGQGICWRVTGTWRWCLSFLTEQRTWIRRGIGTYLANRDLWGFSKVSQRVLWYSASFPYWLYCTYIWGGHQASPRQHFKWWKGHLASYLSITVMKIFKTKMKKIGWKVPILV